MIKNNDDNGNNDNNDIYLNKDDLEVVLKDEEHQNLNAFLNRTFQTNFSYSFLTDKRKWYVKNKNQYLYVCKEFLNKQILKNYPKIPEIAQRKAVFNLKNVKDGFKSPWCVFQYAKGKTYKKYLDMWQQKNNKASIKEKEMVQEQIIKTMIALKNYDTSLNDAKIFVQSAFKMEYFENRLTLNTYLKENTPNIKLNEYLMRFKNLQECDVDKIFVCLNHCDLHYQNIIIKQEDDKLIPVFIDTESLNYYPLGFDLATFLQNKDDTFLLKKFIDYLNKDELEGLYFYFYGTMIFTIIKNTSVSKNKTWYINAYSEEKIKNMLNWCEIINEEIKNRKQKIKL